VKKMYVVEKTVKGVADSNGSVEINEVRLPQYL
jgi:hypothetical protein